MKSNLLLIAIFFGLSVSSMAQIPVSTSRSDKATPPISPLISDTFYSGFNETVANTAFHLTDAKPHLLIKETGNGYPRIRFINPLPASSNSYWDIRAECYTGGPISTERYMAFSFGGSDKMFIKESGGVGIGVINPTEKLEVDGNTKITGSYKFSTAKTHYLSYAPTVFQSQRPAAYGFGFPSSFAYNYAYFVSGSNSSFGYAVAPVNLPDGATITNLWAAIYDNTNTNPVRVRLNYYSLSTYNSSYLAQVESDAATSVALVQTLNSNLTHVVDNANYAYYLEFTGLQNSDLTRLYGVKITYTVTEAD